jgi:acyl-CoA synthetase (AMP-forming)/AMP-acid ligase II
MRTQLCDEFGIDYPIFAFTPSEHVAAAVSRAGGLGVLGCVRFNDTEELEKTLSWLDDNNVLDVATDIGKIGRLGRGGSVPVGYYKDPEKSAKTFLEIDGQRYSVPGDFARIEGDSKVTLLGRGSNCVNTGGEKVYPEEVEMAIKGHPAVYDVLVVGVPDERYGQAVAAVVQPREGRTVELEELRTYLRAHLSGYKLPRALTLVDEIPRNATGKAQYPRAKEIAMEALADGAQAPEGANA